MFRSKILTLLVGLALFTGCGPRDDDALRYRFWGDTSEINIINGLIAEFEAENPGVKIRAERKPPDESYADNLLTEISAGRAPDVVFMGDLNCDKLIQGGVFLPLDPFIDKDPEVNKSDYYQTVIDRYTYKGQLYLLPRDVAPIACIYYNKALFDEEGLPYPKDDWTWKDFEKAAVRLTKRDKNGHATQLGYGEFAARVDPYVFSAGGRQVDDFRNPTKIVLDSDRAMEGIAWRFRLLHDLKVMPLASDQQAIASAAEEMFITGKLGMFWCGIWKTPAFRQIKDFDWDIAPFPAGPHGDRKYSIGSSGYTISAQTNKPELAWKLVKFMGGKKALAKMASTGLAQPAIKSLAASPAFLDGRKPLNKKILLKAAENGYPSPASPDWGEFERSVWFPMTDPLWVSGYDGDFRAVVKKAVAEGNKRFFDK